MRGRSARLISIVIIRRKAAGLALWISERNVSSSSAMKQGSLYCQRGDMYRLEVINALVTELHPVRFIGYLKGI